MRYCIFSYSYSYSYSKELRAKNMKKKYPSPYLIETRNAINAEKFEGDLDNATKI